MSQDIPYIAVGNDELGEPIGTMAVCSHCGDEHEVTYGERVLPDGFREPSKTLAFFKCPDNGHSYLAGINGRAISFAPRGGRLPVAALEEHDRLKTVEKIDRVMADAHTSEEWANRLLDFLGEKSFAEALRSRGYVVEEEEEDD